MLKIKTTACLFLVYSTLFFLGCVNDSYREQTEENNSVTKSTEIYKNLRPKLNTQISNWGGNKAIKPAIEIKNMQLCISVDMRPLSSSLLPVSGNDTFNLSFFNIEILFDGKPVVFAVENPEKSWLKRITQNKISDSLQFSSDLQDLKKHSQFDLKIPLYVFSSIKAGTNGEVSVHCWQDYFLTEEKEKRNKIIGEYESTSYYRDTLFSRRADNFYSFHFTIPEIYKTEISCDSIILQDDQNWAPAGSDNTLWKSSYPDIYFTLNDLYNNEQAISVIEKSTAVFFLGDQLDFYHYSASEPIYIRVLDYDNFSSDDLLGTWKGNLKSFENEATYNLRFGHITRFSLRAKKFGLINK